MRNLVVPMVLAALATSQMPCFSQAYSNGATPANIQRNGIPYGSPLYNTPLANPQLNPYGISPYNPYGVQPYGMVPRAGFGVNPYMNPYANPYAGYPAMGMPVPINGGYFGINIGNSRLNVWKAPSGYYYPWLPRPAGFGYAAPIVIINQGAQNPTPAQPPLTTIFGDLNKFLDDAKSKSKISEADYNHLKLRASDLQKKERSLARAGGGSLDESSEQDLRKDVDKLGEEVAYRVKS